MSETAVTTPKKKEIVYTSVQMKDGTTVNFAGSQRVKKAILEESDGTPVGVRFDLLNGDVHVLHLAELTDSIVRQAACHGLNQKVGDDFAGMKDASVDDISMSVEEMMARIKKGEWFVERASGDSMAGASIVVQAIVEDAKARGLSKTAAEVKDFLNRKLEAGKASGLTRQKLYASFRAPGSRTAAIIRRLEDERAARSVAVDSNALLDEI